MRRIVCPWFFLILASCGFSEEPPPLPSRQDIPVISELNSQEYSAVLLQTFQNARKSICIVLDAISCSTTDDNDPILKLIRTLVLSSMEGVQVRVRVNPSDASTLATLSSPGPEANNAALSLLQSANIPVQTATSEKVFHANLIIVDERIVIEGSQPWISKLDFTRNHYSNTLIVSPSYAQKKLQTLKELDLFKSKKTSKNPKRIDRSLFYPLQDYFIRDVSFWLKDKEQKPALDFFLWLSQNSAFREGVAVHCSIPVISKNLLPQIPDEKKRQKTVQAWIKKLSKADLLRKEPGKEKGSFLLRMLPHEPRSFILFPAYFVIYGYGDRLAFAEKYAYLLCCKAAAAQPETLVFFADAAFYQLLKPWTEDEVNVFLSKLEKHRLIQFFESVPVGEQGPWKASYVVTPPPDPKDLDKQFRLLDQQFGTADRQKAQFLASQLNQELNPPIVSEILVQMQNHGFLGTQKAFHPVMQLPRNHPERNFDRVKQMLSQTPAKPAKPKEKKKTR